MELFKRKTTQAASIPEDLQPYYSNQKSGIKQWVGPILRGLLLLVILALLIWGGIWLVHKLTKNNDTIKTASQQGSSQNFTPAPTTTTTPAASPTPSVTPTATASTTPTAAPTPAPAATNLTNTGPGSIVAIFAVVSAAGALIYRRILVRRLSN